MLKTGVILAERYRLDDPIAAGGVGQVWRGTDLVLQRRVAIKLLRPEYADHPETLSRFQAEARHAGSLAHPAICQVYDYGDNPYEGPPYLVMELVDGPSLADVLAAEPVTPAYALDVLAKAASGLAAAHEAGVVHRDIKPGNILLGQDGQVKITDFGIAFALGSAPVTDPGLVMGTTQYLAPERIAGGSGTPAADLYSLGIVMHECLTGVPPYEGTPAEVMAGHLYVPLPPLPPGTPSEFEDLITRLCAKDPDERLSDAGELAALARRVRSAITDKSSPRNRQDPEETSVLGDPFPGDPFISNPVSGGSALPAGPVLSSPVLGNPVFGGPGSELPPGLGGPALGGPAPRRPVVDSPVIGGSVPDAGDPEGPVLSGSVVGGPRGDGPVLGDPFLDVPGSGRHASPDGYAPPDGYASPDGYLAPDGYGSPEGHPAREGYPDLDGYLDPEGYPATGDHSAPAYYSPPGQYDGRPVPGGFPPPDGGFTSDGYPATGDHLVPEDYYAAGDPYADGDYREGDYRDGGYGDDGYYEDDPDGYAVPRTRNVPPWELEAESFDPGDGYYEDEADEDPAGPGTAVALRQTSADRALAVPATRAIRGLVLDSDEETPDDTRPRGRRSRYDDDEDWDEEERPRRRHRGALIGAGALALVLVGLGGAYVVGAPPFASSGNSTSGHSVTDVQPNTSSPATPKPTPSAPRHSASPSATPTPSATTPSATTAPPPPATGPGTGSGSGSGSGGGGGKPAPKKPPASPPETCVLIVICS